VCLLFIFLALLSPVLPGHTFDNECWRNWAYFIRDQGLRNVYHSNTDYLPLYHYVLWAFGKTQSGFDGLMRHLPYLRAFTLVFDFIGIWYVYQWTGKKTAFSLLCFFSFMNVAFSYNTVIWGQVDGIMATLSFLSVYYAWKKKVLVSTLLLLLALNMKLQAIIFIPVWGLLCLQAVVQKKNYLLIPYSLLAAAALQFLILLPFMQEKGAIGSIWALVNNAVGRYPWLSMNAYNFWHLAGPADLMHVEDKLPFIGSMSYKTTGLILFFVSSFIALLPILNWTIKNIRGIPADLSPLTIWTSCSLVALVFFFFNTQMHERYSHPAFLFLTAYAFYSRRFLAYSIFSLAYFLSLERAMGSGDGATLLHLRSYNHFIFDPRLIALLYLSVIVLLMIRLYRPVRPDSTPQRLND
jgi:Gpi18-like mannosyltransferase